MTRVALDCHLGRIAAADLPQYIDFTALPPQEAEASLDGRGLLRLVSKSRWGAWLASYTVLPGFAPPYSTVPAATPS